MTSHGSTISAQTALCGIVLHPAGHTRSPAMHNAAFRALGIDAAYLAFDVPPAELAAAIAGARALGIRQLAVSIPHKEAVIEHLDRIDETARTIGAVNTVTRGPDGLLEGSNTDWIGGVRALEEKSSLRGARAVVLGAGGTARALVYGLQRSGASVWILNRTESKARALASEFGAAGSGNLTDLAETPHDVLVNTTSVGLREARSPVPKTALRAASCVLDAVYDPPETDLLRDAALAGAQPVGGKWMLVHQAVAQLETWTQRKLSASTVEIMARAFDEAGNTKAGSPTKDSRL